MKFQVWTNAIYTGAGITHIIFGSYYTGVALILLSIASGIYHYYHFDFEQIGQSGLISMDRYSELKSRYKFWQYADVSAIYLLLGIYPYQITGDPVWLLWLVPAGVLILNKFNVLLGTRNPNSFITIAVMFVPLLITGASGIGTIFGAGLAFIGLGGVFKILEKIHYDFYHGVGWHITTGIGFLILTPNFPLL